MEAFAAIRSEVRAPLEAALTQAREALEPFVKAYEAELEGEFGRSDDPDWPDSMPLHEEGLTVGDLRRARTLARDTDKRSKP